MEIITDQGLLVAELLLSDLQEKNPLTSTKYPDKVAFDCGCGESHKVNDPTNRIISIARPVKFLFECRNQYVSFVHVKGIFSQKANCLWSCTTKLYDDVIKGLKEANLKDKGNNF
jgi:hypothetical protein